MNNNDRPNNRICFAIDECLSGIDSLPSLQYQVLQKTRGRIKVKKKVSVGFVLTMVLSLVVTVALAVSIWQTFFEPVVVMETEHGNITSWTLDEKIQLLNLMQGNGIDLPEADMEQLSDASIPDDEKEQIATALIVNQYGREDAISHIDIMEDMKGAFATWSLEDKEWYSQLLLKYNGLGSDYQRNLVPATEDISPETAITIAADAISEAWNVTLDNSLLQNANVSFFAYPATDTENPYWYIEIEGYQGVLLTRSGEVTENELMDILTPLHEMQRETAAKQEEQQRQKTIGEMEKELGPMFTWSLEDKLVISTNYYLPGVNDLTEQEAIDIAKKALMDEYNIDVSVLNQYTPYVWFERGNKNRETKEWTYWYRINFGTIETPHFYGVLMMSDTGEILEMYCPADTEKSNG